MTIKGIEGIEGIEGIDGIEGIEGIDGIDGIEGIEGIAMTAPGIVAHQSALKNGEQLAIPDYDKK